jgi:ABC-type antimicrobial peptide transport system permease subunit
MPSIRKELALFDSASAIQRQHPLTEIVRSSLAQRRFSLMVLGTFAVMALALSMIGIYGVISYFVTQRSSEIGIRLALGATPQAIISGILREGGTLALIGLALGTAGAAGLTRLISSLLFGVSPIDVGTFTSAAGLLFALTLVACYIPARRAIRLDPAVALRSQ